ESTDTGDSGCGDGIPMAKELCYTQQLLDGSNGLPDRILLADLDDDDDLDLIATAVLPCPDLDALVLHGPRPENGQTPAFPVNDGVGGLTWLLGPDASFAAPVGLPESRSAPTGAGRLLLDGAVDLLFTDGLTSGRLPGNGDGSFESMIPLELPDQSISLFADLDGDGLMDAVGRNLDSLTATLSDGLGGFTIQSSALPPGFAVAMHLANLDGDGVPDLLVDLGDLQPMLGLGDGSFAPATQEMAVDHSRILVGHFDGDGLLDVGLHGEGQELQVRFGDGNGGFLALAPAPELGP
ncbi:MAG: VCBS repeat-containing protein, partial [Myxococcales bacterium]|nr:VCBS repeat-containing protein [Myxococcales bacterium]